MVASGPVRRNFGGASQSNKRRGLAFAFFTTLIVLIVVLSGVAIHLSRQVIKKSSFAQNIGDAPVKQQAVEKSSVRIATETAVADQLSSDSIIVASNDSQDRVYCMIPFIWNEEIYNVIMETWGKRCDVINFLTDSIVGGKLKGDKITEGEYKPYWEYPAGTFPNNVKFINMTRTWHDCPVDKKGEKKVCRHIWEKMWRSWVYVEENHLDQAEWFCKVDYDTFFFPDNVKHYVRHKKWNPFTEYHYFGHLIQHRQKGREPMIAGATACWSRKTLDDIADVYRKMPKNAADRERGRCEDRGQATEEASTSLCLARNLNVTAYAARDDQVREHITVAKFDDVLTWNRTKQGEWWYWKGKPKDAGQMENTISRRPIGLHKYKSAPEIHSMEQIFFGKPDNNDFMRLKPRTKSYVLEVRKTMGIDK